jgi:hypothetical protein
MERLERPTASVVAPTPFAVAMHVIAFAGRIEASPPVPEEPEEATRWNVESVAKRSRMESLSGWTL